MNQYLHPVHNVDLESRAHEVKRFNRLRSADLGKSAL